MLDRRGILGTGAALASLALLPTRAKALVPNATYGMIEIGAKGLKVNAYSFRREAQYDEDGKGASGHERSAAYRVGKGYTVNTSPVNGGARDIEATVTAAKEAVVRLTSSEFGVRRDDIAIVASSGVAAFPKILEPLSAQILAATGSTLDSVTPAEEAKMSYDWIVLQNRRQQVLLIDIGSGNTKGGYYEQVGTKQQKFRDFSVPLGTLTFANAIRKITADKSVSGSIARRVFDDQYLPALNSEIDSAPGVVNRPRIYLSGGIFWATALLTKPAAMASRGNWVRMTGAEFATLKTMLERDDPYLLARTVPLTPDQRTWLDKQLTSVAETFNPEQLAAGNALCLALRDRLNFAGRSAIFFATFAVDAWSSQYLLRKFRSEETDA